MARDVATTKYVRWRLLHWRDDGGDLKTPRQIQQETGALASAISQIRSGKLGVGPAVAGPLARAWGMSTGQLMDKAREWYEAEGRAADDLVDEADLDPELAEALTVVRTLGQVSDEQLRAIVAGYGTNYFRGRDKDWWIQTLLSEASRLRKGQGAQQAGERIEKRKQAEHRKERRKLTGANEKADGARRSKRDSLKAG